jgi:hypothetical protein
MQYMEERLFVKAVKAMPPLYFITDIATFAQVVNNLADDSIFEAPENFTDVQNGYAGTLLGVPVWTCMDSELEVPGFVAVHRK